jgi:hypothetical protein
MIAALLSLLIMAFAPLSAIAADSSPAKGPTPKPSPIWTLNQPASCSAVGPPPCPKCTVTCKPGQRPLCTAGESSAASPPQCVKPPGCECK